MSKLIFGNGYLGARVANRWLASGEQVHGVTRSEQRGAQFASQGMLPLVADITQPGSLQALPVADTVLFAVGLDRRANMPIRKVYVDGLRNVLDNLSSSVGHFIYISSTGVYSQSDGGWVDEESPCEPTREGGQACLEAERLLAGHPIGARTSILRLAGIYGPGRIPRREQITSGQPLSLPTAGYLNLIHVDDAAKVVCLVDEHANTPRTYLVADGHPVIRGDYYLELAKLLAAPPPRFQSATELETSPKSSRAESSKRISNERLVANFGNMFDYPSYREGLRAIVQGEQDA